MFEGVVEPAQSVAVLVAVLRDGEVQAFLRLSDPLEYLTSTLGRSAALVRWRTMSTAIAGAVSVLAWSWRRQVRWVASATSYARGRVPVEIVEAVCQHPLLVFRRSLAFGQIIKVEMLATPDQQISLTDPDARSMATSGRGSGVVGYNVQIAVEAEHHLIVTHEVTNEGSDRSQLSHVAKETKATLETPHLLLQLLDLLFQAARLGFEHLGRLLPVDRVELLQIARDALLDLRHAPLHLRSREVPVAVVHRLELAAVDRDAGLREQANHAAQRDEACANLADCSAIVLAEVCNRLVIGDQPARQPHHLNSLPSLTLKPSARLNPVEIAVDIELQQDRRMIRRPAGCLGIDPVKPKLGKVEFLNKYVNHPNRIVLDDPVL